jgi:hypothetical protein
MQLTGMSLLGGMQFIKEYESPPTLAGSLSFNGTTATMTMSPGIYPSTGAFTIEGWFYNNSSLANVGILGTDQTDGLSLFTVDDTTITLDRYGGGGQISYIWDTSTIKTNTWQYIVLNRDIDGAETMWIGDYGSSFAYRASEAAGGTPINQGVITDTYDWGISDYIGNYYGGYFPGNMTNMRITVGDAKYNSMSSTINIPIAALEADAYTKYLMLGAAVTTDSSGNQTITNSNVTQSGTKPF